VACLEAVGALVLFGWQRGETDWRTVLMLAVPAVLTVPIGIWILHDIDPDNFQLLAHSIVLTLALLLLLSDRQQEAPSPSGGRQRAGLGAASMGMLSGILTGATTLGGPPVILYTLGRRMSAALARSNLIAFFAIVTSVNLVALAGAGLVSSSSLELVALLAPLNLLAIWAGQRRFQAMDTNRYRAWALLVVAATATAALLLGWQPH